MSKNKKDLLGIIKLQIPSGKANPSPPIGPALGQKGLNIMDFCKQFNAMEFPYDPGTPMTVVISAYKDKSFSFIVKTPPTSYLIIKAAKVTKGSSAPGKSSIGSVTVSDLFEIAKKKMVDMNSTNIDSCFAMVKGSAISIGIEILD